MSSIRNIELISLKLLPIVSFFSDFHRKLNLELSYFSFEYHGGSELIKVQCLCGIFDIAVVILTILKICILVFHFLKSMIAV